MAVITQDFLAATVTNFRTLFGQEFPAAMAAQYWRELAIPMDSNGAVNTYTWFGNVPKMENVTHGFPSRQGLPSYSFSITNEEWQAQIEVERAALERDQMNLIRPRISGLAQEAARHPGELIWSLFANPGLAFDGLAYFADTRVIGNSANIDNLAAGTGVTVAQIQADLNTNRGVMRAFQDEYGRPMNLVPNTIVVPPSLEQSMFQALNANMVGTNPAVLPANNQSGRIEANGYSVYVNPYLTDVTDWYLMHLDAVNKPFIIQVEKAPELLAGTNPNEQAVIESRKFLYAVNARYNVGITDPRFAIKVVNAG